MSGSVAKLDREAAPGLNGKIIGGYEILDMIVIEIAHGERINAWAGGIEDQRRPEGPISVSQQDRDAASHIIGRHEVLTAVTVEIAHRERSFVGKAGRRNANVSRAAELFHTQFHRRTSVQLRLNNGLDSGVRSRLYA